MKYDESGLSSVASNNNLPLWFMNDKTSYNAIRFFTLQTYCVTLEVCRLRFCIRGWLACVGRNADEFHTALCLLQLQIVHRWTMTAGQD